MRTSIEAENTKQHENVLLPRQLWELRLSGESFHKALIKIYLTFQPQLFQAIRPIVLPSSRCPKNCCLDLLTTDTNGPKEIRQTRMQQSSPFPPASYWDLFIRNRMQIICYSWAFLTHGHRCGVLFVFDRLKLLLRTQRRVNLINHVDYFVLEKIHKPYGARRKASFMLSSWQCERGNLVQLSFKHLTHTNTLLNTHNGAMCKSVLPLSAV